MKLVNTLDSTKDFSLTPGENFKDRLPKRFAQEVSLFIDGSPVKAPVTINRGWAGDQEVTLYYPWIMIESKCYYLTLTQADYDLITEAEYTIDAGKATRVNPKRVTVNTEREQARVAAFRATYAARTTAVAA